MIRDPLIVRECRGQKIEGGKGSGGGESRMEVGFVVILELRK